MLAHALQPHLAYQAEARKNVGRYRSAGSLSINPGRPIEAETLHLENDRRASGQTRRSTAADTENRIKHNELGTSLPRNPG